MSKDHKDDAVLMMLLRNRAKDKDHPGQGEARSILKKIETRSLLTAKDEKLLSTLKKESLGARLQTVPDYDHDEYQFDQSDMVSPETALETYGQYVQEHYDKKNLKDFFTVEKVEDILSESKEKLTDLKEEMAKKMQASSFSTDELNDLLLKMKKEEEIQKKNTSVSVYSLSFETIHTSTKLQEHVMQCERVLLRHFFHAHFLPGQLQSILCAVTNACDCVVSMRTGGGKTMIFAMPALLEGSKTTIVFSPLRSLIFDQMNEMKKLGIESGYLMSEIEMKKSGGPTRHSVLRSLLEGDLKVLFTTPEQAFSDSCLQVFKELIAQNRIARIVIDEAHLLRQWESFRSKFQNFGTLRSCFPGVPMILMTACLPRATRSHLSSQIGFSHVMINRMQANRCNAFYMVSPKSCNYYDVSSTSKDEYTKIRGATLECLMALLRGPFLGASAIIYCRTATLTGILSKYIQENIGKSVSRHFHAQLSQEERLENQKLWSDSTVPVMVATCAFGLGINHPHVRLIVHWDLPQTLDDYFQQAGRAGRDGAPCVILSFYHPHDLDAMLSLGVSDPQRTVEVACFMENRIFCRRALILSEYAERCPPSRCGTSCDVCYYQSTWSLYDISRFANCLLALVMYLPQHIEALDVKRNPFRWLVSLLRCEEKAIKSLISIKAASLCKPGIVPGCGSMKNLSRDDTFTIVLSLYEHGVFKLIKQETKVFGKGMQSHTWKIAPGDNVFFEQMSSHVSRHHRLVKARYAHSMLIPLPTATIQRLQKPVGGSWNDSPDHMLFCGWCKEPCFSEPKKSFEFQVRPYPCAPILAHKECIDDEHDDLETRREYDDPENCILCRSTDKFYEGSKKLKSSKDSDAFKLIICFSCGRSTCYSCLKNFYEIEDDTIATLTSLESARWFCANCDPFTVPLCYQWHRAEQLMSAPQKHKDVAFTGKSGAADLMTALLQQTRSQCQRALQFSEANLRYMEEDLLPLEKNLNGDFPLFCFVSAIDSVDSVQHYYMILSHSSAGAYVYAVEFVINPRSNALQPPKPNLNDLFDETLLLRFDCQKIKQVTVETKPCMSHDGTPSIWCPANTISKFRRELLSKIKSKQRYTWSEPSNILPAPKVGPTDVIPQLASDAASKPQHLKNAAASSEKRRTTARGGQEHNDGKLETKKLSSSLTKRPAVVEQSSVSKSQKVTGCPSATVQVTKSRSKLEEALHRARVDSNFSFVRKDSNLSFQHLILGMMSHSDGVFPLDQHAIQLSQKLFPSAEYGEFSIFHAIFLALHSAVLPVRSSDIATILQSMGLSVLYSTTFSLSSVIQNTLTNYHADFPRGIFDRKKHYWFLNRQLLFVEDIHPSNPFKSKRVEDFVLTDASSFGRCLKVRPTTFLRVKPETEDNDWFCMVTTEKGSGRWHKPTDDKQGTLVLVRWFEVPKAGTKTKVVRGAQEIFAYEGGTEHAWDWININSILEVIHVKWGEPEPHELNWFEFYYTKNINNFEVSIGAGKKNKMECCISDCNPVQYEQDFWDESLREFQNPDPYESKLYDDPEICKELFDKSVLPTNLGACEARTNLKPQLVQDRSQFHLICARNFISRHYPHPRSTKMNIRNCFAHEYADLYQAVIFALLENQMPMPFETLCDKIGVPKNLRGDLNSSCKVAFGTIFWVEFFIDAYGQRSKHEYISLLIWEVAFKAFQSAQVDIQCSSVEVGKSTRDGVSWKRAYESVSKAHPRGSMLYKCALISLNYPLLCERHLASSAPAAYCMHEIANAINLAMSPVLHSDMDPECLKILQWGCVCDDIMRITTTAFLEGNWQVSPQKIAAVKVEPDVAVVEECIVISSDDEPALKVIDIIVDDGDSDGGQSHDLVLPMKRPLQPDSIDVQLSSPVPVRRIRQTFGNDAQLFCQFSLLLFLKSLQSNIAVQLSSVGSAVSNLFPEFKNANAVVELVAIALHDTGILVFYSESSDKVCDPSPCFQRNVDNGLVISAPSRVVTLDQTAISEKVEEMPIKSVQKHPKVKDFNKFLSEFSFVAPPQCQSFQDQDVFLRSTANSSEVEATGVTQFTSMYSHFTHFEQAALHLARLEEDDDNFPSPETAHPIVQLVQGTLKDNVPQDRDDDNDLDFLEPLSISQDDESSAEAFKPYCRRPDSNLPDYRKKIKIFLELDFEVAFFIEFYVSSGSLSWNALDHQDLEKLERYSFELVEARKASLGCIEILNKIKVLLSNKVNLEKLKGQVALDKVFDDMDQLAKKPFDRKKVLSDDILAMERCTVFSGVFVGKRGVQLKTPSHGKYSCRAYRKFGSDRFLTVSIPRGTAPEHLQSLLDHGFKTIVGDRLYRFVPSGDSHLKERKLMFFAVCGQHLDPYLPQNFINWHIPISEDPNSAYFPNSQIISIKFFARFQLCFSVSAVAMTLSADEYEYINDIEVDVPRISKKVCATDGCGRAPPCFFVKIKEVFKLAYVPSCVQIRFGGCKGLLHVDNRVSKVQFRSKSQRKYICDEDAIEQRRIEVTSWSLSHQSATSDLSSKLNLQLAFVLRSMGVPDEFFFSLLKDTRDLVLGAIGKGSPEKSHRDAALEFVRRFKNMPQCEEIQNLLEQNVLLVTHPFIVRALRFVIDLLLNPIQNSFHMPVPEMKFLYGVPDPTGILRYGQCFVFLGEASDGAIHRRFEDTDVLVGRNPMQHPGDVRKLTAVFVQELYLMKLVNVLVLPVVGNPETGQLLNDEMSGGDFDGDQYIFIWNKEITQHARNHDPYPYYLEGTQLAKDSPSSDAPPDSIEIAQHVSSDVGSSNGRLGCDNSDKVLDNVFPPKSSDASAVSFETRSVESATTVMSHPTLREPPKPEESAELQSISSSNPTKWTSDDVKGLFNSKIGTCSEEAYEKLKLCALGVLCHWDNVLVFIPLIKLRQNLIQCRSGRLCNLQRDIADCSLHQAKLAGLDNPRNTGFADPECMQIAPLVARAVDSLKTGEIVRVPKKNSKIAEHWYKGKNKESSYCSSSLFGIICKSIGQLQHSVQQFVFNNSYEVINSQLIESMCMTQNKVEVLRLVQKVRKRVDEEFHVIFESASQVDAGARSQQLTEGIARMCKEEEEFVRQYLVEKGFTANLGDYIRMFVGLMYQSCYTDMQRRSENAFEQRRKAYDARDAEDSDFRVAEVRAERDSSAKWTLVQLPFKMFSPILSTIG